MSIEMEPAPRTGSLVLYKSKPALVTGLGAKLEIELENGKQLQVRLKDVTCLHPGPLKNLGELTPLEGEIEAACEILQGENTTLAELAELVYGDYSPASAWSVYQLLEDGLYFQGIPWEISVRSREEVEQELKNREAKSAEKELWAGFLERLKAGRLDTGDHEFLKPLEEFARGNTPKDRILKALNIPSTPENAHRLLLKLNQWDQTVNPHVSRLGFALRRSYAELGVLPGEDRLDLTHLPAYAIDDEGNQDPDDAISWDGEKLWVHIADVAALVPAGSPADLEAAGRGANLYLPEATVTMLPPQATALCGLGLQEVSPALSFAITLAGDGSLDSCDIRPSLVKVTRLTYADAEMQLAASPFKELKTFTDRFRDYRRGRGAVFLRFPDVKIRVTEGRVVIRPLPELESNGMVLEAMLMAGEAAARFALERQLPFPYTTQPAPDSAELPGLEDLAAMFAFRRKLKPSQIQCAPSIHGGLGLGMYSRATSPLRRYVDLLAHQQIRAHLAGREPLDEQTVLTRIGTYNAIAGDVQKLERLSNLHWTLVYLQQNPDWNGRGIVVARREREHLVSVPDLGLEAGVHLREDPPLNTEVRLRAVKIDLPELAVQLQQV